MKPCLVLNKIDRLCLEMKLTPTEAFYHLRRLVENANALASTLLNSELRKREELHESQNTGTSSPTSFAKQSDSHGGERSGAELQQPTATNDDDDEDPLVNDWNFSPENGNVIFASALDCWGFGVGKFATIWATKLGLNRAVLQKHLFEDFSFNSKTKKIVKCDPYSSGSGGGGGSSEAMRPMFASMVLDPIWQLYDIAVNEGQPKRAAKMAQNGVRHSRSTPSPQGSHPSLITHRHRHTHTHIHTPPHSSQHTKSLTLFISSCVYVSGYLAPAAGGGAAPSGD